MNTRSADSTFHRGDAVVLALGTYQGTPGVFLQLKEDTNWADIMEPGGNVRSHPVRWLAYSATTAPGSTELRRS